MCGIGCVLEVDTLSCTCGPCAKDNEVASDVHDFNGCLSVQSRKLDVPVEGRQVNIFSADKQLAPQIENEHESVLERNIKNMVRAALSLRFLCWFYS